ncbi:MAG: phosphatidate cytidylyltransferase [Chthonomonadaceae bacterium]|nr:phosphatidate cytidylyltransferase [Chthonomonadaceae bacterium]
MTTSENDLANTEVKGPGSMGRRVSTAVFGGLVSLFALFTTHALPVAVLAVLVAVVGFAELVRIAGLEDRPLAAVLIGLLCYVLPVSVAWSTPPGTWYFWATLWLAYAVGCLGVLQGLRRGYSAPMAAAWLGAPLATVYVTHQQTPLGTGQFAANLALLLLVPLWIGDTMALLIGRKFGRHKLAPAISPSKTWEGAIANFMTCILTAVALGALLRVAPYASFMVGAISGVLGQLGDLAQSALKRVTGLKDSGAALPGHGGVLDRLDSFLLSSVPCATVLWLSDPSMFHVKLWP